MCFFDYSIFAYHVYCAICSILKMLFRSWCIKKFSIFVKVSLRIPQEEPKLVSTDLQVVISVSDGSLQSSFFTFWWYKGLDFDLDRLGRTFVDKLIEIPLWKAPTADLAELTGITRKEILSWSVPEPWRGILGCERCLNRYNLNRIFFCHGLWALFQNNNRRSLTALPFFSERLFPLLKIISLNFWSLPEGDMKA